MPTSMLNFPIAQVVDALLSFVQHRFSKPEMTPSSYRWNAEDRQSRIRISGSHAIDNEKPGSRPSITIERGSFVFSNSTIDNLKTADTNTFLNPQHQDWMAGPINIICESRVASEASSIANYLAYEFQANRETIARQTRFIKDLSYVDIGPEEIQQANVESIRWRVVLRLKVNLYMGWLKVYTGPTVPFNKAMVLATTNDDPYESTDGALVQGQDTLVDAGADFGLLTTSNPQLLQAELDKSWYYIVFDFDTNKTRYIVTEIVDNNTLKLKYRQEDGALIPYDPSEDKSDVSYTLEWNAAHLHIELPINT